MKLIIATLALIPSLALAQSAPPTPSATALWPMLSEAIQREAVLREELGQAQVALQTAKTAQAAAEAKLKADEKLAEPAKP